MIISITGTRRGAAPPQLAAFRSALLFFYSRYGVKEVAGGSCAGVDTQTVILAREVIPGVRIIAFPGPDDDPWRRVAGVEDEIRPGKNHFARNRDLVERLREGQREDGSRDLLITLPGQRPIPDRGGTRYTFDYAGKRSRARVVIWPDGSVDDETGVLDGWPDGSVEETPAR